MRRGGGVAVLPWFGLFFAVRLAILGFGAHARWISKQVEAWPTARGSSLERHCIESSDSDGTTCRVVARDARAVCCAEPASERIAFGDAGSSGHATHRARHDRLMSGDPVRVRRTPFELAEAALAAGWNMPTLFLPISGAVRTGFTPGTLPLRPLSTTAVGGPLDPLRVR